MFSFVEQVIRDFSAATALEQAGFILSLAGLSALVGTLLTLFGLRNHRALVDQLRRDASALADERDQAERQARLERERAERWMPSAWLEQAQRERTQGNEELAIQALSQGFERTRKALAAVTLGLAGHHLSRIIGAEPLGHLEEGERLARLSALLDPQDPDAAFLVEDAELARSSGDVAVVSTLSASFIPHSMDELRPMVSRLNSKALDFVDRGRYRLALRLFRRSLLLMERGEMAHEATGQAVRLKVAECLLHCGLYDEALETITALLSEQQTLPRHDEELFRSKVMLAGIRQEMGESQAAFDTLIEALAAFAPVAGEDHPYTLAARCQLAGFLLSLDRPQQALDACAGLLPALIRIYGPRQINTLITYHHEALALAKLGRHQEALDRLETLLPIQRQALGDDHPAVLATRRVEAELLFDLGRTERSLELLDAVLDDMVRIEGPNHPHVVQTRAIREEIATAEAVG